MKVRHLRRRRASPPPRRARRDGLRALSRARAPGGPPVRGAPGARTPRTGRELLAADRVAVGRIRRYRRPGAGLPLAYRVYAVAWRSRASSSSSALGGWQRPERRPRAVAVVVDGAALPALPVVVQSSERSAISLNHLPILAAVLVCPPVVAPALGGLLAAIDNRAYGRYVVLVQRRRLRPGRGRGRRHRARGVGARPAERRRRGRLVLRRRRRRGRGLLRRQPPAGERDDRAQVRRAARWRSGGGACSRWWAPT